MVANVGLRNPIVRLLQLSGFHPLIMRIHICNTMLQTYYYIYDNYRLDVHNLIMLDLTSLKKINVELTNPECAVHSIY